METLKTYFPELQDEKLTKLNDFAELLVNWNQKINLISRKDTENVLLHHVMHSLAIAKVFQFKPGTHLLDVGTGGGLPGIPLAIVFPDSKFHLIDSKAKKVMAVSDMIENLELPNATADQIRLESYEGSCDFIISRAVTNLRSFVSWIQKDTISRKARHNFPNGVIYLKGGEVEEEILETGLHARVYELSDYFPEDYFETKKLIHLFERK
jgi:16S rRNA (guanine527-N7)-methyltransferase